MDRGLLFARFSFNKHYIRTILLFSALALSASCSLAHPFRRIETSADFNIIAGYVRCNSSRTGTIVVVAYKNEDNKIDIVDYTTLHESGPYELLVPRGRYHVLAFGDENNDLVVEKNELLGKNGDRMLPWIKVNGIALSPDIVISNEYNRSANYPIGLAVSEAEPEKLRTRPTGETTDLKNEIFDAKYGEQGYWEPKKFLREIGANIFFLEDYNPEKTPVLFIHGATGSPRGWRCFIDNTDRTRFQPWLYYYPSGAPVRSMSNMLYWNLLKLKKKYLFDSIFIIAHSMGGLVARSFIMDFGEHFPFVRLFLSISTPWGGDKLAEFGVQQSPVVIPCWQDLQPDGKLLSSLYSRRMPEGIDFYLFFGHKGDRNPFRSNNDGTISLASLLDLRSQSDAKMIIGFNEDHDSILCSKEVQLKYNAILNGKEREHIAKNQF